MPIFDDEFPMMLETEADPMTGQPTVANMETGKLETPVAVSFGSYPMKNDTKSREVGHDFFEEVEFVKIAVPGDKMSLYFQPAQDTHRRRFPKAYAAFKARTSGAVAIDGMPIEQWAGVSRSAALTLRAAHIHTVEALANVHDGHIERLGTSGRELRAKAKAFLAQAKDSAETMKLAAEKKELQDELDVMRQQIAALVQAQQPGDAAAARKPKSAKVG